MGRVVPKIESTFKITWSFGRPKKGTLLGMSKALYGKLRIRLKREAHSEQKWASLSSSIDKNGRALEELRDMNFTLFINKELLTRIPENPGSFYDQNLVSAISVHPSLVTGKVLGVRRSAKERRCRLDPDIGVKMKFVVELIRLCGGPNERIIIFS
ncbi:hypothetical protein HAX54_004109 [Datura stramonium]|uniref:Uncharacterized protein n=1 Tax=Datura stramonium TaxID=4076 RepID=A0ABS8WV86_DATST|nr:hypothetical protein [Datura stramonium]